MKTMDCATLETLIENHEPVNLIDIRTKKEFRQMHIIGARSVPFATLASPKGFLRYHRTNEQIYVVSDDQVRASLATGILRASGYINAMVIEGGMNAWLALGFPVWRQRLSLPLPNLLSAIAVLFATVGIALAIGKLLIVASGFIVIGAAAVLLRAGLFTRTTESETRTLTPAVSDPAQWRSLSGTEPAHAC
jgi:rhodanese-related sulfurtransferase